jgi:D-glycero-D-manno-heptose 1,7-bisphosphate phosphatase
VEILQGVAEGCKALRQAGFLLIVVTNQPDVARGTQRREVVKAINKKISSQIPLDDILVCFHDKHHRCNCRKPKPGLILEAAERFHIDLRGSYLIGDRWSDIEAARRSGCKAILVNSPASEASRCLPNYFASSFAAAAKWILQQTEIIEPRRTIRKDPGFLEVGMKDFGVSEQPKKI